MIAIDVGTFVLWMLAYLVIGLLLLALALGVGWLIAHRLPNRRVLTRLAVGVGAAAMIVPSAAVLIYTQVVNDPEPRFDTDDLADLVGGDAAATTSAGLLLGVPALAASATEPDDSTGAPAPCPGPAAESSDSVPAATAAAPPDGEAGEFDGEWVIAEGSEFGYRVPEVLQGVDNTATGRGQEIEGSFTVAGGQVTAACFVVQVASITSSESMRDGQFNSRIMETAEFPTATFVLTAPIVFDESPEVGGDPVTVEATGDLTLHGVTQEVTFEVTTQAGDDVVGVLGEIPIVFADYAIEDPSGGPAQVGDEGTLEFLLAFERATAE